MDLKDIALLVFSCVAVNHLGLIAAAEERLHRRLPVLNCSKCLSFWTVLSTTVISGWHMPEAMAISFACAYIAMWIELAMGFVDLMYYSAYEKIYTAADTTDETADATGEGSAEQHVPNLQQEY